MDSRSRILSNVCNAGLLLVIAWLLFLLLSELVLEDRAGRYAVIAVLACAGCVYALTLESHIKANLLLAVVSLGIGLCLAELVLFLRAREDVTYLSPREMVTSLRKEGVDAYPPVFPALHVKSDGLPRDGARIFPLSGLARKVTVYCKESERYMVYLSDRHGFNNPDDAYAARPEIIVVGDSFAHGACVQPGEDIGGQLRRLGWSVVNLGFSGNGPLLELATVREYVIPLRPRTVLWLYYEGNDLRDLQSEKQSPLLLKYLNAGFTQDLMGRQGEVAPVLRDFLLHQMEGPVPLKERLLDNRAAVFLRFPIMRRTLATALSRFPTVAGTHGGQPDTENVRLLQDVLRISKETIHSFGGELYFVYLPASSGIDQSARHSRDMVLASVRSVGIPLIDFHDTVRTLSDPAMVYPYHGAHFSASGYALLAKTIDAFLKSRELVPHSQPLR